MAHNLYEYWRPLSGGNNRNTYNKPGGRSVGEITMRFLPLSSAPYIYMINTPVPLLLSSSQPNVIAKRHHQLTQLDSGV